MDKIIKIESVTQFNTERGQETLHPLVTVLDQSRSKPIKVRRFTSGPSNRKGQKILFSQRCEHIQRS